jgi:hypothetical protein
MLGFSVGFGHDLAAAVLLTTRDWTGSDAQAVFGFLPPLSIVSKTMTAAGYGYWGALVCVLVAAALRFTRSRPLAWIVGIVATLFVAADAPLWFGAPPAPSAFQNAMAIVTLHGALMAWLSLAALVLFSWLEGRWEKKRVVAAADTPVTLKSFWDSLKFGKLGAAGRQLRILELARQLRIATAEWQLGKNPQATAAIGWIRPALAQATAQLGKPRPPVAFWKRPGLWILLQWALLAVLLFLPQIASYAWDPQFTYTLSSLFNLSLLNIVLAAVVGYRYLAAGIYAARGNTNDLLQYGAENGLLRASLWAVLLAAMLTAWDGFYGFNNLFTVGSGVGLPDLPAQQLSTLALAFALVMTAQTRRRAVRSRPLPIDQRRAAAVWRFMTALSCFLVFNASLDDYMNRLENFHQQFGPRVYALSVHLGTNGNKLASVGFVIENTLRLLPLILLLMFLSRRIAKWFRGSPPSISESVATVAAALFVAVWVGGAHAFAGGCTSANDCICMPPGSTPGPGGIPPAITTVSFGSERADDEAVIFGDDPQASGDPPPDDTSTDGKDHSSTDTSPAPAKPPDITNQPLGGDDLF